MVRKPIYFDTANDVFVGMPDLREIGFARATLMGDWGHFRRIGDEYDYSNVDPETAKITASYPGYWDDKLMDMIVLDEESIPVHTDDLPQRDVYHDQLIEVVRIFREAHPGLAIGHYAKMPESNFYGPLIKAQGEGWGPISYYEEWLEHNKQWLSNLNDSTLKKTRRGLASQVDRVLPALYNHWNQGDWMAIWKIVHDGVIEEAEKYHKPIMPYLSPQFKGFAPYYEPGEWAEMLGYSLAHPSVDGVVIFQSIPIGTQWDESASWWQETLSVHKNQK